MGTTDMEKMEEAENALKEIENLTKQKQDLEKQIAVFKRKIVSNRNRARTYVGMNLYGKMIVRLGFASEEKNCSTRSEFEKLQQRVLARINELLELERIYNEVGTEPVKSEP